MIAILHTKPLTEWAKKKLVSYQYKAGLNTKKIRYVLSQDYTAFQTYSLIMPLDDEALKLVADQWSIRNTNCYVLEKTSRTSCPVIPCYHPQQGNIDPSRFLFISTAFKNAKRYLDGDKETEPKLLISNDVTMIDTYLKKCEAAKLVCIDLETIFLDKLSPITGSWKDCITAVGISIDKDEALCFSRENLPDLVFNTLIERVARINANPNIEKIGQNYVMFDSQVLYFWQVSRAARGKDNLIVHDSKWLPKGNIWDTMHMFNILYPNEKNNVKGFSKALLEQIRLYLLSDIHKDDSYTKRGITLRQYCALDVVQTFRIWHKQKAEFVERGMEGYYEKYRLPLGAPTVQRQILGLKINRTLLKKLAEQTEIDCKAIRSDLHTKYKDYVPMKEQDGARDYLSDRRVEVKSEWNFPVDLTALGRKELDKLLLDKGIVTTKSAASKYFVAKKQHLKKNPRYEMGSLYTKARMLDLQKQTLNPNSGVQLIEVFKSMGQKLPQNSTNATSIETLLVKKNTLAIARDFCESLKIFRKASKFLTTYCNVKLDMDGRLRSSFNLEANDTGRSAARKTMWGTGFNIQTIPSFYTELGDEDEN